MSLKLKQFRIKAGLTQAKLAKAVGVSQPNYQRWESGAAPIPEDKLKKLTEVLQVGVDTLLGRHAPVHAGFYDESAGEDLNYYGEVSIHFQGGGKPLLLSITDGECSRLYRDLQRNSTFVTVESLANQTAIIRKQAIADLYFSSEAYDDYGPEHRDYEGHVLLQMPDTRDWEIVEALSDGDENVLSEYSTDDVRRVSEAVMITDDQYEVLLAEGRIRPENLEREKNKNQEETRKIFNMATNLKYQLSNGRQRSVLNMGAEEIFEAFYKFFDFDGNIDDDLVILSIEGAHRIAFINKAALDYIIIPTHRLNQGRIEVEGKMLDEIG